MLFRKTAFVSAAERIDGVLLGAIACTISSSRPEHSLFWVHGWFVTERRDGVREGWTGVTTWIVTASSAELRRDGVLFGFNTSPTSIIARGVTADLTVCFLPDLKEGVREQLTGDTISIWVVSTPELLKEGVFVGSKDSVSSMGLSGLTASVSGGATFMIIASSSVDDKDFIELLLLQSLPVLADGGVANISGTPWRSSTGIPRLREPNVAFARLDSQLPECFSPEILLLVIWTAGGVVNISDKPSKFSIDMARVFTPFVARARLDIQQFLLRKEGVPWLSVNLVLFVWGVLFLARLVLFLIPLNWTSLTCTFSISAKIK